jgi:glycosyltransferase involved in cell wall biosynthesis
VIAWGSYDESKPRVRLLLDELEAQGVLTAKINIPVWSAVRDKAVAGRGRVLKTLLRLLVSYPSALIRLMRQPSRSAVLLAYPAIPDIFAVWPVARLRRDKIIFDAFISLHDTLVSDRAIVSRHSLAARLTWGIEWLALRMTDIILVDTDQHGDFFAEEFGIRRDRFQTILVGAEPAFWNARIMAAANDRLPTVLFYGQLIPLHGLDAILDAIRLTKDDPIRWLLIGSGQEEPKLRRFLDEHSNEKMTWLPWVDYVQLPAEIAKAQVALGIFGTSDKAGRVIPNKAFQVLAAGKPLITRESPALKSLATQFPDSIRTVPAGDGAALADAVREALKRSDAGQPVPTTAQAMLGPSGGVQKLMSRLSTRQSQPD